MSDAPVVVVGAGIGGLACALQLASRGVEVVVVERAAHAGGKLREVDVDGRRMDAGPTVLTMRWVFEELFAEAGERLDASLKLAPLAVLARHAWDDRTRLDLFADLAQGTDAIGAFAGAGEARRYRAFCERAQSIFETLDAPFLRNSQPNPVSLASRVGWSTGWKGLNSLARISPFATMWDALGDYFHDPRLRQLFGRYATYCGSSPFHAPATLMLVAHVEREGVWLVDGGMNRIADALVAAIERHGGSVRLGTDVRSIAVEGHRAVAVVTGEGQRLNASAVVFNGDSAALAEGLLGSPASGAVVPIRREQRSLSAITWHLRARTRGFPLLRHTVFFGGDTAKEFRQLFDGRTLPDDPTVYVCAQDRDARDEQRNRTLAAAERLMCLVNAPADADTHALDPTAIARCGERMFERLAACGLEIASTEAAPVVTTPTDFARLFPATGGALYGRATHGWMSSFERPASRSKVPGLYLAGGSVHPGPGLPMAALSGRLAAEALLDDRGSRRRRA